MTDAVAPPPFCIAPWVHAYRGTDGFRSLCGLSTEMRADHESFEDWWNSAQMREARRTLIAGEIPGACAPCVHSNRASGKGYNTNFAQRYGRLLPAIVESTDASGATTMRPRSIDYRTAHCNLKCRTCDARNSSSIYTERARLDEWLPPRATSLLDERTLEPEALAEADFVYWAGGEPLMSPAHQPAMDRLIASGRAPHVTVHYTSNLMHWNPRTAELMRRYSTAFSSITLAASIDGLGDIGAYVRHGWDEKRFFDHLVELRTVAPRIDNFLDVTLTNIGMLCLPELLAGCARNSLKVQFKLMECNHENDFLDLGLLKETAIADLLARCRALGLPAYHQARLADIENLLQRRYRPTAFTDRHRHLLQRSEARRGAAGFFARHLGGRLNGGIDGTAGA